MELEIRHLRVICTVAETGSVSRAAAALRVSQPSLSAQLHRIERMLGGTLFERRPQGIAITPFGAMVLARARAVLPTIDELSRATTRHDADPRLLRLGSVNAPILAGLVTGLRSRFPGVTITTYGEGSPTPLVDMIANNLLELAVAGENPGYDLPVRAEISYHTVATEPVFVLLSSQHPLAGQSEIALPDLADEDFGLPRPDDDRTREYYALACLAAGFEIRVPYGIEGTPLLDLIRAGHAITFCQATYRTSPGITTRPIVGNPLWYRHVLIWHRNGPFKAHAATITALAAAAYDEATKRNPAYPGWLARYNGDGKVPAPRVPEPLPAASAG
jgi:DNA-binding transcriptional LysR family regulator